MKIALIEDDQRDRNALKDMLAGVLADHGIHVSVIRCFSGGEAFFAEWEPARFDLILLDIYLGGLSGVDIAGRIRQTDQNVALVFCTSSNDFAAESYAVNAGYYLRKPVTAQALSAMLRRINARRIEANASILLPDGHRVLLRRLIYTNYVNHLVTFYLQGQEPHALYITQAEVERLLDRDCFYAANQGSIINFHMVRRVTEDCFLMKDGSLVPISRRRYKDAREAFKRFHFRSLGQEVAL